MGWVACGGLGVGALAAQPAERTAQLWQSALAPYLADPLWQARDAYDAGHVLMPPLHAAYAADRPDWRADFRAHFARFRADRADLTSVVLTRLQYLYLLSRWLVLEVRAADPTAGGQVVLPAEWTADASFLLAEVERFWRREPAWQWRHRDFPGGIEERLNWKLANRSIRPAYLRGIIDEEQFLFALAADLEQLRRRTDGKIFAAAEPELRAGGEALLASILAGARRVYAEEVRPTAGGGWLLQPGGWSGHRDYAYAGQTEKRPGLEPAPLADQAADSSHSHRLPLWLLSLQEAGPPGAEAAEFYRRLRIGLAAQFTARVLVAPSPEAPFWRTHNFMDGRNGLYRWEYPTQGPGQGYGPYELSGTMLLGWWAFLPGQAAARLYHDLAAGFPPPPAARSIYLGPGTTRPQHPLLTGANWLDSGLIELDCRLAAQLAAGGGE